jgi:hypothetical protein
MKELQPAPDLSPEEQHQSRKAQGIFLKGNTITK